MQQDTESCFPNVRTQQVLDTISFSQIGAFAEVLDPFLSFGTVMDLKDIDLAPPFPLARILKGDINQWMDPK